MYYFYMKCKQPYLGLERVLLCPFLMTVTIMPQRPYIYERLSKLFAQQPSCTLFLPVLDTLFFVIIVFWVVISNGAIHLFTYPQTQHGSPHQMFGRDSADLDLEGGCFKTLRLAKGLCHGTETGEPSLGCGIIFLTLSFLTCGLLILQIAIY